MWVTDGDHKYAFGPHLNTPAHPGHIKALRDSARCTQLLSKLMSTVCSWTVRLNDIFFEHPVDSFTISNQEKEETNYGGENEEFDFSPDWDAESDLYDGLLTLPYGGGPLFLHSYLYPTKTM